MELFNWVKSFWKSPTCDESLSCYDRCEAVKALGQDRSPKTIGKLIQALDDPNFRVQIEAAKALGRQGEEEGLSRLGELLHYGWFFGGYFSNFEWVRETALEALGEIHTPDACHLLASDGGISAAKALAHAGDVRGRERLLQMLKSDNEYTRNYAAKALGEIRDPLALEPLIKTLQDSKATARKGAVEGLGLLENTAAIKPLVALLEDENWEVRTAVWVALARIGDPRGIKLLQLQLEDENDVIVECTLRDLGKIGEPRVINELKNILCTGGEGSVNERETQGATPIRLAMITICQKSQGRSLAELAVSLLGQIGTPAAVEILSKARTHPDLETRADAYLSLIRLGVPELVPEIVALMGDTTFRRRWFVEILAAHGHPLAFEPLVREFTQDRQVEPIRLLGQLGDLRAVDLLLEVLNDKSSHSELKISAAFSLGCLRARRAVHALSALLIGPKDWALRVAGAHALGMIGGGSTEGPLLRALTDVAPTVRATAAHALGCVGGGSAKKPLATAKKDTDETVRKVAEKALEALSKR